MLTQSGVWILLTGSLSGELADLQRTEEPRHPDASDAMAKKSGKKVTRQLYPRKAGCMKRTLFSGVLAAGLLVIAAVSFAHADSSITLTAKVPFAFSVGTVSLPAGEYTFNEYSTGLLLIRKDRSSQVLNMTYSGTSSGDSHSPKLVFHRYEDQYFLSEVFNGRDDASRKVPVSKLEKEQIAAGAHSVAENSRQRDVVVLAALATR